MLATTHHPVHSDPTLTVENITQVLNKMNGDRWKQMYVLPIPDPLLVEIQTAYSTDAEQIQACVHYYINYHPEADWEELTNLLYRRAEFPAVRESKSFMSTGKC